MRKRDQGMPDCCVLGVRMKMPSRAVDSFVMRGRIMLQRYTRLCAITSSLNFLCSGAITDESSERIKSSVALGRCEPPVQADRNRLTAETSSGPARWEGALATASTWTG